MKKALLLLTTILSIVTISHSQKWSAGYRTGFRQLETPVSNDPYDKDKIVWTNQIFLDRKITKRFEAELTFDYAYKNHGTSTSSYFDGPAFVTMDQQTSTFTLGLYLRYYIYQHSRLRLFGQAGFINYKSWTNYQAISYDYYPLSSPVYYSGTQNSGLIIAHTVAIGAGVNYDLSSRFYLNGLLNVNYYTATMRMTGSDPLAGAAYVGLGFRF